ncbi:MAG: deoxyribodipyrimidine photo-lyase [Myxococcales bacterium]|nr:deoxyribodipyrimidine photo-lyase [Myxococcales bacterium]
MSFRCALVLFRRDLRLEDNVALLRAVEKSATVIPAFVFDPRQTTPHAYFSVPGFQFMVESLVDLDRELVRWGTRLRLFVGEADQVVGRLISESGVDAVFVNEDYTPFSVVRDDTIRRVCISRGTAFLPHCGLVLHRPGAVMTQQGQPFKVYTPFANAARKLGVGPSESFRGARFYSKPIGFEEPDGFLERVLTYRSETLAHRGGRSEALRKLSRVSSLTDYAEQRDLLALDGTSNLSPYLKFGCCSPREVFQTTIAAHGPEHGLIREIYWREFFTHLAWHFPHVFRGAFHSNLDRVQWDDDPEKLRRWQTGCTGFPIVDAAMRQLVETGTMHNRARMVVASFLTKDLHIHWQEGEKWFARHLLDYDPCVNNGNWQWAASTGADAQPYFRIFNPWLQQQKFDPDAQYIRRWLPQLRRLPPKTVHTLHQRRPTALDYPPPMVDHGRESADAKARFGAASSWRG